MGHQSEHCPVDLTNSLVVLKKRYISRNRPTAVHAIPSSRFPRIERSRAKGRCTDANGASLARVVLEQPPAHRRLSLSRQRYFLPPLYHPPFLMSVLHPPLDAHSQTTHHSSDHHEITPLHIEFAVSLRQSTPRWNDRHAVFRILYRRHIIQLTSTEVVVIEQTRIQKSSQNNNPTREVWKGNRPCRLHVHDHTPSVVSPFLRTH